MSSAGSEAPDIDDAGSHRSSYSELAAADESVALWPSRRQPPTRGGGEAAVGFNCILALHDCSSALY